MSRPSMNIDALLLLVWVLMGCAFAAADPAVASEPARGTEASAATLDTGNRAVRSAAGADNGGGRMCPPGVRYYHADATGNLLAMTDEAGQVVWRAEVAPFGQGIPTPPTRPLRFVEQPREEETGEESGLYHMGARYYDPLAGRFLSPEPIPLVLIDRQNPQRFNCFAYALNNPYGYQDAMGTDAQKTEAKDRTASSGAARKGATGWDVFKWVVGTLDWTRSPLTLSGIASLTADTVGILAIEAGHDDAALAADVAGKGLSIYAMVTTLSMSWVGGTLMYLDAVKAYVDASDELRGALLDPNATNGLGAAADYSRYGQDKVKAWCEQGNAAACYNYVARGGKPEDLQFKQKKEGE